jgi:hypothetical protein
MFEPGTPEQLIGFSRTKKTCGLAIGDDQSRCVDFAEAQKLILRHLAAAQSRTNLMIEAPLSVSFRAGLPAPRSGEKREGKNRFWYHGPGCGVMVASMYLIKAIHASSPPNLVRLFEAFVSYKKAGAKSDHGREAALLRHVVREPKSRHLV